jgi:galactose mutarotase-like enzyme
VAGFNDQGEASVHYRLVANDYTREYYPFEFQLDLVYCLRGQELSVTFDILNLDDETLYYSFGWHPGFSTPILRGQGRKADCRLLLPAGSIRRYHNNEHCRLTGETSMVNISGPLHWSEEGLELTYMYEIDSPDQRSVRLEDPACGVSIRVDFPEFPHLGFWSEPGDPFICIEPWQGMDDHEEQESFDQKVGMMKLAAGGHDRRTITVVPSVT